MASDFYKKARQGIEKLVETREDLSALASYYEALLQIQEQTFRDFSPDLAPLPLNSIQDRTTEGLALLAKEDICPDWNAYDKTVVAIADATRRHAERRDSHMWPTLGNVDKAWHEGLLGAILSGNGALDKFAESTGASSDLFAFLAFQALIPFVEAYATALQDKLRASAWLKGSCPVCGAEPLIGILGKETGKRFLQCSLCRTEWPAKRMECPFCENSNQKELRFFADEKNPAYRVDVCDKCKTYLKIIDERKAVGDVVLFAENIATLHMDLVAREEGFKRDTSKLLGF